MRQAYRAFTVASALLAVSAGCNQEAKTGDPNVIKIVSSLPRVGSTKGITDQIAGAIQMAIADFEKVVSFEVVYRDWDDAR